MTKKINGTVEQVTWYFTQYCNYQFDDDAIAWMMPYFAELEEDGAEIAALLDLDDSINTEIHANLSKITADAINAIVNDFEEIRQELYDDGCYEPAYTADTWWDIADEDLKANGMDASARYWIDDLNRLDYDGTLYELNGYCNGFNEFDMSDTISDADVVKYIVENY